MEWSARPERVSHVPGLRLHLLPPVEPEDEGLLPSEIAAELVREIGPRATEHKVGMVISQLGLRGDPKYSTKVFSKARGHDKTVTPWKYNAAAVALIKPEVSAWVAREAAKEAEKAQTRAEREERRAFHTKPSEPRLPFGGTGKGTGEPA